MKFEVEGRSATPQELLDELVIEKTQKAGTTLTLPEVPEGYQLEISSSSNQKVINLVGTIADIEPTMDVNLYLKLTRLSDESAATKKVTITVVGTADKRELEALIQSSEEIFSKAEEYTEESYRNFANAYREAKRVMAEKASDQLQIDEAKTDLQNAIDGLESKEEPSKVDKSLLQKTYDEALTLSTEGVTDSAKAAFEKALAEAKAVLDDAEATQEEVNTAWDNLLESIFGLGIVQGDKSMLGILVDKAESMILNKDKYVQDNW